MLTNDVSFAQTGDAGDASATKRSRILGVNVFVFFCIAPLSNLYLSIYFINSISPGLQVWSNQDSSGP